MCTGNKGAFFRGGWRQNAPASPGQLPEASGGQWASTLLQGGEKLSLPRSVVPGDFLFLLLLEEKGPKGHCHCRSPHTLFALGRGSLAISHEATRLLRTERKAKQKRGTGELLRNPHCTRQLGCAGRGGERGGGARGLTLASAASWLKRRTAPSCWGLCYCLGSSVSKSGDGYWRV